MDVKELKLMANTIRQDIIRMVSNANSGHPAGALGMADIFAALYFKVLNHNPKKPDWVDRDRLVLSNGHICAVRYSSMARSGYFPVSELLTFRKLNSRLQGHPSYNDLSGVESSSGSLGQGISVSVGMAIASRLDKKKNYVFCVSSDGDLNEGSSWEAINAAAKWKLDNLIVIVDRNYIQISGKTEEIWPLDPLDKKFESFNWKVYNIDGHNIKEIISTLKKAKKEKGKPKVIIARTIIGKGVSYMENNHEWHGKPPNEEEAKKAIAELDEKRKKII
ncbi:MAG: transketolase [Nanoarchaeota archaeon]|nr:transketolase [Nanoarchaeota archaeon]MBU1270481.1 transketolase [Nanoarchaeota archaeon]